MSGSEFIENLLPPHTLTIKPSPYTMIESNVNDD